jgi:hypothetical protein
MIIDIAWGPDSQAFALSSARRACALREPFAKSHVDILHSLTLTPTTHRWLYLDD